MRILNGLANRKIEQPGFIVDDTTVNTIYTHRSITVPIKGLFAVDGNCQLSLLAGSNSPMGARVIQPSLTNRIVVL